MGMLFQMKRQGPSYQSGKNLGKSRSEPQKSLTVEIDLQCPCTVPLL